MKRLIIYTDGAATPNPGPAAIGVVVLDETGKVVAEISRAIGRATNNRAEYLALIAGLTEALRLGADQYSVKHIPRERNEAADALSHQALHRAGN